MRVFPEAPFVRVLFQDWYELRTDYRYIWMHGGTEHRWTVPAGFLFDGASIPRLARIWLGPWSLGLGPPLIHDHGYRYRGVMPAGTHEVVRDGRWQVNRDPWSRSGLDRLMARMMREKGVPKFRRRMAYRAIRLGGWYPWLTVGEDWS